MAWKELTTEILEEFAESHRRWFEHRPYEDGLNRYLRPSSPQERADQCKRWRARNQKRIAAYRASRREKERLRLVAWRKANREKKKTYDAAYRIANREKEKARMDRWRAKRNEAA